MRKRGCGLSAVAVQSGRTNISAYRFRDLPKMERNMETLPAASRAKQFGKGAVLAAAIAALSLTAIPTTAHARGGVGTGAAIGLGLLGGVLAGAAIASSAPPVYAAPPAAGLLLSAAALPRLLPAVADLLPGDPALLRLDPLPITIQNRGGFTTCPASTRRPGALLSSPLVAQLAQLQEHRLLVGIVRQIGKGFAQPPDHRRAGQPEEGIDLLLQRQAS